MIAFLGSEKRHKRRLSRLSKRKNWGERTRRERGVVLVWFALMLVALLGIAGFAVDLSNWWLQAERLQKAADAGALAGVVYLPADVSSATSTAGREVARNGFVSSGASKNATVVVVREPNPNRLRVRVTTEVRTYFVGLLGVDKVTLNRDAVAEFVSPVPMGSPENRLGNDPEINYNPQTWTMISGPNSDKEWGDRYHTKPCKLKSTGNGGTGTSGCTNKINDEYDDDGYIYALEVKNPPAGQDLKVQIYDPIFMNIGSTCGTRMPSASQLNALKSLDPVYYADAPSRYASGATKWCSGDFEHEGKNVNTAFIVRAPDNTEWNDTDNPIINTAACSPQTFRPFNPTNGDSIYDWLRTGPESIVDNQAPWTVAESFRRWVTVCTIPSADVVSGKYILQVRTNATAAAPTVADPSISTGGHNRYSMRGGFGTKTTKVGDPSLTISARGRLPLFTNANAAAAEFYLARVLPFDAGRTLRISLFDMGDVSGAAGSLKILPPVEELGGLVTFKDCSFVRDGPGTLSSDPSTCSLKSVSSANGYQGKLVTIDVPIPSDYQCNDLVPTGCWVKVLASFPGGVNDVTTWSAAIVGNPVRLVE